MRKGLIWASALALILGVSPFASAHSILSRETKVSGDYQVIMEATADVDWYEGYAITYTFLLLNKDGSQYATFDAAKVMFSKDRGGVIMTGDLDGPKNGLPGTELDVAMPVAGDYAADVSFLKNSGGKSVELAKASFNFSVLKTPTAAAAAAPAVASAAAPETQPPTLKPAPPYVWALVLFIAGITLGALGPRIYVWVNSK